MNILFAQSDDLVVSLLTKWIPLRDVVRLDTACASSNYNMKKLHRLLASKEAVFSNNTHPGTKFMLFFNKECKFFQWLLLRKVKVTNLVLTSELIAKLAMMEEYFVLCGSVVQSLNVINYDRTLVSIALKHCHRLKTLYIQDWDEQSSSLVSECVDTFSLSASSNRYRQMPGDVVIDFPKLKYLTLTGSGLPESVLAKLIENSTLLQRIELNDCHENTNLSTIMPIGHSLQHLALNDANISSSELGAMLQRMPQLTKLVLSTVFDTDRQDNLRALDAFKAVGNCPTLTAFHYIYGGEEETEEEQGKNVTALTFLLNTCPYLREICVRGTFVSDVFLQTLASHPIAPNITHLTLTQCDVSEIGLAEIARKGSGLQSVRYTMGTMYRTTKKCKDLFRQGVNVHVQIEHYISDSYFSSSSSSDSSSDTDSDFHNDI